jgi:predicted RNA-binding Zn-ribbon protein involved in translation (DUF1610 family)
MASKILFLDIEVAPKVALVWKFFKENISPKQVKEHGHIMSFCAKWLDDGVIHYEENRKENDKDIIQKLCYFIDQADIVIAHNGEEFDMKEIRARALVHGIKPPSPVKVIDTYKIAKREFRFPSNSLEYLSNVLNLTTKKGGHKKFPGFELWLECLRGNDAAWAEMKEYNIVDVLALEELYYRLRPWDTKHPNLTIYASETTEVSCPKCGSHDIQWRGYARTNSGVYHRYQCNNCGSWGRGRYSVAKKNEKILTNQVN